MIAAADARWGQTVIDPLSGARHRKGQRLTPDRVRAIRAAHAAGEKLNSIALREGVSAVMVGYIVSRRRWSAIP